MVKPTFEARISLGNVLTVIAMVVAGIAAFYSHSVRMETLAGEVAVLEARLNGMESETKRRLESIEQKLDTLLLERRANRD